MLGQKPFLSNMIIKTNFNIWKFIMLLMSSIYDSFRREQILTCPFCKKSFEGKDMLDAHKKIDHG